MGASLKRPPGSKKAKKELLFRDSSLSGSTVASVAMETMVESHSALVTAQKELVAEVANQTRVQSIKEQMAGEQMKCTIYQGMGNDDAVLRCLSQIEVLQAELAAMRTEPQPRAAEDECPVEEVDLIRRWISPMQKWMTVRKLRTVRLCKMWRRCIQQQKCRTNTRRRLSKLFIY
jgi:hypothetical protein